MMNIAMPTSKWAKAVLSSLLIAIPVGLLAYTAYLVSTDTSPINQAVGYVGQDEITEYDVTSGHELLFRPEYEQQYWSGTVHAYPVDVTGSVITSGEKWSANAQISSQSARFIATMDSAGNGVPFQSTSSMAPLSTTSVVINAKTYTPAQIISFLRGDQSMEGQSGLRQRLNGVFGDVIHSRPYYQYDANYPTVFVGANDGMLHAIDYFTGFERWAYVPSMLLSKLATLAYSPNDITNVFQHNYFVDGQINVGTVGTGSSAKNILVGGLGAGGKGIYALDVTDSTAGSSTLLSGTEATVARKVLWEITPTSVKSPGGSTCTQNAYANLGFTYGQPLFGKVNVSGTITDAVIIGNGLDTNSSSGHGSSVLYVINASTGCLIKSIVATTSGSGSNGIFNTAGVDTTGSGYISRVYGGDLNGTMWKFDVTNGTSSALYTQGQPITSTPAVAVHPYGGYIVDFATGSTLNGSYGTGTYSNGAWSTPATGELANTAVHYAYGIWDGGPSNGTLITQTLTERSYTNPNTQIVTRVRRASAVAPDWTRNNGWKIALPAGERVVGEGSFIDNGRFYFNAYNPTVAPTAITGTTSYLYGENWLVELNYLTGGSSTTPFLDLNNDQLLNTSDRIQYITSDTIPSGSSVGSPILSPNEDGIPVGKFISAGVQSQPILVQLATLNTTLFNQNPDILYPSSTTSQTRGVAGGHFDVDFFQSPTSDCSPLTGVGANATGTVAFTPAIPGRRNNTATINNLIIKAGPAGALETIYSGAPGTKTNNNLAADLVGKSSANYTVSSVNANVITITAIQSGAAWNGSITVSMTGSLPNSPNPVYTVSNLTGGVNAGTTISASSSTFCYRDFHKHEWDKLFDVTGVDFLNPSDSDYKLSNAIPSSATQFKVLVMNQYLNPAIQINIGNANYQYNSWTGYTPIKNFQASFSTRSDKILDISTVPSYTMSTIKSLTINMPVNAFSPFDWWAGVNGLAADMRVGVMPTSPTCVYSGPDGVSGNPNTSINASLYNPVVPPTPSNGLGTGNGNGTNGTSAGVRHNGAVTVQIIRADTPQSAIEFNDPSSRPEYGFRVSDANYYKYVIAEYSLYWHHPARMCYGDPATTQWYNGTSNTRGNGTGSASSGAWNTAALMNQQGWSKTAPPDILQTTATETPATGSTDPHIGSFGSSGLVATGITTTTVGNTTTQRISYTDGSVAVIVTVTNADGTATVTTTTTSSSGSTTTATSTVANAGGSVKTGGDERGIRARDARISWRELVRP